MPSFDQLVSVARDNPCALMLVLTLLALGWVVRTLNHERERSRQTLEAFIDKLEARVKE